MLDVSQILVSGLWSRFVLAAIVVVALDGCGQKGMLYLPTGEAAASRATLPQALNPAASAEPVLRFASPASATPATGTASPVRTP